MRQKSDLYKYQVKAVDHILEFYGTSLWLSVGLGKSIVSLTAVEHLLDSYLIRGALVVAPLAVVESVWRQEAAIWDHTKRLTFSVVRGTPQERIQALQKKADIYLINYEQLMWLVDTLKEDWIKLEKPLPFDMLVMDEVSKMKNSTSKRGRALVKILPYFKYRVGLTGTPASNGYIDLHGQYLMIDGGHRLGPNITGFRNRWFMQNQWSMKWEPRTMAAEEIKARISDITLEMSAADYLELPPLVTVDRMIEMDEKAQEKYDEFEKELFAEIDGDEVEAFNAAAKSMKCRQLANGAFYTTEERKDYKVVHNSKLDMLEELVDELNGQSLFVCYQFKHDKARIAERFPNAVFLDGSDTAGKIDRWNAGQTGMLVGHPASAGHGINLQHGGHHICWYGLTWSLELYEQAIGRLMRNGQKHTVFNYRLLTNGTVEEAVKDAIEMKGVTQRDLRDAIKQYRLRKG